MYWYSSGMFRTTILLPAKCFLNFLAILFR